MRSVGHGEGHGVVTFRRRYRDIQAHERLDGTGFGRSGRDRPGSKVTPTRLQAGHRPLEGY